MSTKSAKATQAIKNSQESNPHSKYVLDGRVYNSEKYAGPLKTRKEVVSHLSYNEKVSATYLYNIERMLQGYQGRLYAKEISKETRELIAKKYDLHQDDRTHRWVGDPDEVFAKLCKEYPHAIKYKKYSGLLYAMKYGDTPCVTYKGSD